MNSRYPESNSKSSFGAQDASRAQHGEGASSDDASSPTFSKRKPYPGVFEVVDIASEMVTKYTGREKLREVALKATKNIKKNPKTGQPDMRNFDAVAQALYEWVIRNVNYVRDPWDVERIQTPDITIRQQAGDCDDHAILGATLLQSLGIETGFRVVSRTGRNYDHIYAVYKTPQGWKTFDTTIAKYAGYEFDEKLIKKSKHVSNSMPGMGTPPTDQQATTKSTGAPLYKKIIMGIIMLPVLGVVASKLINEEDYE